MTLNGRNVPLAELKSSYGALHKNVNEDRLLLSVAKCRPMDFVSRNIKYMGMFVGTPDALSLGRQRTFRTRRPEFRYFFAYLRMTSHGQRSPHTCARGTPPQRPVFAPPSRRRPLCYRRRRQSCFGLKCEQLARHILYPHCLTHNVCLHSVKHFTVHTVSLNLGL